MTVVEVCSLFGPTNVGSDVSAVDEVDDISAVSCGISLSYSISFDETAEVSLAKPRSPFSSTVSARTDNDVLLDCRDAVKLNALIRCKIVSLVLSGKIVFKFIPNNDFVICLLANDFILFDEIFSRGIDKRSSPSVSLLHN